MLIISNTDTNNYTTSTSTTTTTTTTNDNNDNNVNNKLLMIEHLYFADQVSSFREGSRAATTLYTTLWETKVGFTIRSIMFGQPLTIKYCQDDLRAFRVNLVAAKLEPQITRLDPYNIKYIISYTVWGWGQGFLFHR